MGIGMFEGRLLAAGIGQTQVERCRVVIRMTAVTATPRHRVPVAGDTAGGGDVREFDKGRDIEGAAGYAQPDQEVAFHRNRLRSPVRRFPGDAISRIERAELVAAAFELDPVRRLNLRSQGRGNVG